MSESKIEIKIGEVQFSGEGEKKKKQDRHFSE